MNERNGLPGQSRVSEESGRFGGDARPPLQRRYSLTTDPSKAEILIVNTCSFIQDASQEAIDTILNLARYKKEGRCRRLIVSGCLPQRYGKALEKELPEVDLFVGTGTFQNLPRILTQKSREKSYLSSFHLSL